MEGYTFSIVFFSKLEKQCNTRVIIFPSSYMAQCHFFYISPFCHLYVHLRTFKALKFWSQLRLKAKPRKGLIQKNLFMQDAMVYLWYFKRNLDWILRSYYLLSLTHKTINLSLKLRSFWILFGFTKFGIYVHTFTRIQLTVKKRGLIWVWSCIFNLSLLHTFHTGSCQIRSKQNEILKK